MRSLLARGYAGFTDATKPSRLVIPASAAVPLVLKIRDSAERPPAFVHGVHRSYAAMIGACAPTYLEAWLAPLGAYALLGLPMDELEGQVVDLGDVVGAAAGRRLTERVREAPTWGDRFALMDEFLLRRAAEGPRPSPEVGWAWRRLVITGGRIPISRLAGEVGWSHKRLIAGFRRQIGLPPKTAARLVRFDQLLARLDERRPPRWDQLAAEGGYSDQAHLVRDFREFTGAAPTAFMARVLASPQAAPAPSWTRTRTSGRPPQP
ncbi:hypothetical protein BCD48_32500 [Pseudofrankia sp. BMG5.36]|nr:hypothetical protein BCD48_32500 [Pseudofrankia sp. BMG5.36]